MEENEYVRKNGVFEELKQFIPTGVWFVFGTGSGDEWVAIDVFEDISTEQLTMRTLYAMLMLWNFIWGK